MSDEELDPMPAEGGTDEGATVPKSELQKAIAKRQQLKQQLSETTAKLAEYEAKEKEAEKSRLKAAEDWDSLEKQLTAERDAIRSELEGERRAIRRKSALDAVAKATGREAARSELEILMLGVEASGKYKDLDWAPEELSDRAVDKIVRTMKKEAAGFFAKQAHGGTPGAVGQPVPVEDRDDQYYKDMGKRWSPHHMRNHHNNSG